ILPLRPALLAALSMIGLCCVASPCSAACNTIFDVSTTCDPVLAHQFSVTVIGKAGVTDATHSIDNVKLYGNGNLLDTDNNPTNNGPRAFPCSTTGQQENFATVYSYANINGDLRDQHQYVLQTRANVVIPGQNPTEAWSQTWTIGPFECP